MKPKLLKKGDTIGVVACSEPITKDCIEEIEKSVRLMEQNGLQVKFGEHAFENPTGYGETAKHKAEDFNKMFADEEVKRNLLCNGWIQL